MSGGFTREEAIRYGRHLSLAGFGPERQDRLRKASVLVIGAGGLGCPSLLYLAAAGVGRIVLVDFDRVDVSNLQRQVLFATEDVGQPKALAAARRLKALNPLLDIQPRAERFSRENARGLVRSVDLVVDGSDNFSTRYLVNDACVLEDRPFVYGAVQGFEGQASVFNYRGGPTYRCLFPEPPAPGSVPNCAEAGVLGVMPGTVGLVQATEAIKVLAGIGEPLSGRLWLHDALSMRTHLVTLTVDPRSREIRDLPPEGYGETCAVPAPASAGLMEIDVQDLRAALAGAAPLQLLDVREDWERAAGAIEPSVHIPLGELERGRAGSTLAGLDPKAPTVVYCAGGVRSLRAAKLLRDRHQFREAVSLRGGFHAWDH
jgi:molybdopterin/thiamine biosynthesis adenylyltransferase/rhodanese-related sulfurtransferase